MSETADCGARERLLLDVVELEGEMKKKKS